MKKNISNSPELQQTELLACMLSKYHRRIYGYVLALVPNFNDAEDLFQETLLVICRRFDEFDPDTNFLAWGLEIARRKVIKFRQTQSKSKIIFNESMLTEYQKCQKSHMTMIEQKSMALKSCIKKLSPNDQNLLRIRYDLNDNIKEIAKKVNRPIHGLYKVFTRIHLNLRECVNRTMSVLEKS